MAGTTHEPVSYSVLALGGTRYAVVPEAVLFHVCRLAGVEARDARGARGLEAEELGLPALDGERLARRIARRRRSAGLTQAELARRAGIRVETLNRVERGRTTPDFATIRKLVEAMNAVDAPVAERPARAAPERE